MTHPTAFYSITVASTKLVVSQFPWAPVGLSRIYNIRGIRLSIGHGLQLGSEAESLYWNGKDPRCFAGMRVSEDLSLQSKESLAAPQKWADQN
jgi:hypothetical protein